MPAGMPVKATKGKEREARDRRESGRARGEGGEVRGAEVSGCFCLQSCMLFSILKVFFAILPVFAIL